MNTPYKLYQKWTKENPRFYRAAQERDLLPVIKKEFGCIILYWNDKYHLLEEFVRINSRIPKVYEKFKNIKLGGWVVTQRANYKLGQIDQEKIDKLETIPGWSWYPFEKEWFEFYNSILKYVNLHNSLPKHRTIFDGRGIGAWCNNNRNKKQKLTNEQIQLLEKIPYWTWHQHIDTWNKNYIMLKEYVEMEKTIPSSSKKRKGVGKWCERQRKKYRKGKLSDDKIKLLEAIPGWWWEWNGYSKEMCIKAYEQCKDRTEYSEKFSGEYRAARKNKWLNEICGKKRTKAKPVIQSTKEGNSIQYNSATEAEKKTGIRLGDITACCRGAQKTAGGYFWKYAIL